MTRNGLLAFLQGAEPRAYTLKKLHAWYVTHGAELGVVDVDALDAAVSLLLDGVPDEHWAEGRKGIMGAVRETYQAAPVAAQVGQRMNGDGGPRTGAAVSLAEPSGAA